MGLPPWLAIPAALPLVSLIVLFYIALTPWPAEARWHEQGSSGTVSPPD